MAPDESRRTTAARERLREHGADAIVLAPGPEQRYLSGFATEQSKRHTLLIIQPDRDPVFFLPEMFAGDAAEASWLEDFRPWGDTDDPAAELEALVAERGLEGADEVLVNERMWATFAQDVRAATGADLGRAGGVLTPLRMTKDAGELAAIREASDIADAVSEAVRGPDHDLVGATENQVVGEIEYAMRQRGGEGAAFETIVAGGPNSAKPAYRSGHREIEAGDPVILDFGCAADGYLSDQTRTVVAGGADPPDGFAAAHDAVRAAQDAAVDAVAAGVTGAEVDAAARAVLEDHDLADRFPHVTGHGVGLDIHEPPFLIGGDYLEGWNRTPLEPGMVFSVEPAVYTEEWGLRVEDLVALTEDGPERLNDSPRGWRPL